MEEIQALSKAGRAVRRLRRTLQEEPILIQLLWRGETPELFKHPVLIDEAKLEFERFSVENADVKNFTCGNKDLDDFLTTDEVEFYEK